MRMPSSRQAEGVLLAALIIASVAVAPGVLIRPGAPTVRLQPIQSPTVLRTCLDGGKLGPTVSPNLTVAVVKPVFTSTPYSQYPYGSFYAFFKKYDGAVGNITNNLDWLRTNVASGMSYNSGWGHTLPLYSFLASSAAKNCGIVLGRNLHVISDIDVANGALFGPDRSRRFDAVMIGHQEYVTQREYDQLRLFVAAGGRLVAMSSNEFYAEVKFDPVTQVETFVTGHGGYSFNGHTAWYGSSVRPPWNTGLWFGSTYCCFHRFQYKGAIANPSTLIGQMLNEYYGGRMALGYSTHEENAVSNLSGTSIIATFLKRPGLTVASYAHGYGRGVVFCLCVFGEDLMSHDRATQYFLVASLTAPFNSATASSTTVSGHLTTPATSRGSGGQKSAHQLGALGAIAAPVMRVHWLERRKGLGARHDRGISSKLSRWMVRLSGRRTGKG